MKVFDGNSEIVIFISISIIFDTNSELIRNILLVVEIKSEHIEQRNLLNTVIYFYEKRKSNQETIGMKPCIERQVIIKYKNFKGL